ncbi:MAG: ribonuclease HIII [Planctomycetota bacterium]|nr:ribonuclease HIII [Planctomycetota bacterium]
MSATLVFELDAKAGEALGAALRRASFRFTPLRHALFQARGEGVVVSLYASGRLVVQGRDAEAFHTRFLGDRAPRTAAAAPGGDDLPPAAGAMGSDEAGKGDTFGPLVVAAVALDEATAVEAQKAGIADSKALTDTRVRALAEHFSTRLPHEIRVLPPVEYHAAWVAAGRNVNKLLTRLHVECLVALRARSGAAVAVVDRFAADSPVRRELARLAPGLRVVEVPRAERHAATAAASVLARAAFLDGMDALEREWAVDLPLGSGDPVGPALRLWAEVHGKDTLGRVAKLHFKNVQKFINDGR